MRKLLMALVAMFVMAGLVVAGEVFVVSYKDKVLTYKEGKDKEEMKATITDSTKFQIDVKGEKKDSDLAAFEKRFGKGKGKADITVKDGKITEVIWKGGKGK